MNNISRSLMLALVIGGSTQPIEWNFWIPITSTMICIGALGYTLRQERNDNELKSKRIEDLTLELKNLKGGSKTKKQLEDAKKNPNQKSSGPDLEAIEKIRLKAQKINEEHEEKFGKISEDLTKTNIELAEKRRIISDLGIEIKNGVFNLSPKEHVMIQFWGGAMQASFNEKSPVFTAIADQWPATSKLICCQDAADAGQEIIVGSILSIPGRRSNRNSLAVFENDVKDIDVAKRLESLFQQKGT